MKVESEGRERRGGTGCAGEDAFLLIGELDHGGGVETLGIMRDLSAKQLGETRCAECYGMSSAALPPSHVISPAKVAYHETFFAPAAPRVHHGPALDATRPHSRSMRSVRGLPVLIGIPTARQKELSPEHETQNPITQGSMRLSWRERI